MQDAIQIRAFSDVEAPKMGSLIPLSKDVDRLSFIHAWAQAKKAGACEAALKPFATHARCMRVPTSLFFSLLDVGG